MQTVSELTSVLMASLSSLIEDASKGESPEDCIRICRENPELLPLLEAQAYLLAAAKAAYAIEQKDKVLAGVALLKGIAVGPSLHQKLVAAGDEKNNKSFESQNAPTSESLQ